METAAFFDITNTGGADDRLVGVTSSATGGQIGLSRHRMTGSAAAVRDGVSSATVRAGGKLSMSPQGLDAVLRSKAGWQAGDLVSFTLRFEHSGAIETLAVVVRPSGA
ncbi:copper chaperone PCu(A)C [Streptomyces sp. NPDC054834]